MKETNQIERLAYRVGEWAQAVGISRSKAYEEIAAGLVPGVVKIGKSVRVTADGARQYLARLTSEARQ
jgi:predicted DNA-binding transcriptional regulator AlpA